MVDLLEYLRGDGRLYEVVNNFGTSEVIQTQTEARNVFYHVKNSQWEELWADDVFIYRGTDCSPGNSELYMLSEANHYGSAWVPRWFNIGQTFKRTATVIWRRKDNGQPVPGKPTAVAVTYLRLERIYSQLTFQSGMMLQDVAELHAFVDDGGKPASSPWEKYFYGKGFGLVSFEDMYGGFHSWIAQKFTPETMPQRIREVIPWLPPLQRRYYLPAAPTTTSSGQNTVTKISGSFVNIRNYPNVFARDIGDLKANDVVTLYTPEASGWARIKRDSLNGWVARQEGGIVFTPTTTQPPPPTLPPVKPLGKYTLTQLPSSWVNVRDYPNESGHDIGDLHKNDEVTLYKPDVDGWVYAEKGALKGWVSRQSGAVVFTKVATPGDPIPPDPLPPLPKQTPTGQFVLTAMPSTWVNVRAYPIAKGTDVGDLHTGDLVTLFKPEVSGWVFIDTGVVHGWVSRQGGAVVFTAAPPPPIPHDDLPPLPVVKPVGQYTVTKIPSTWVNVRAYPNTDGTDIGDLHLNDVVVLYTPEVSGWVFVSTPEVHGWVSRQSGAVTFTALPKSAAEANAQAENVQKGEPTAQIATYSAQGANGTIDAEAPAHAMPDAENGADENGTRGGIRGKLGRLFRQK